MTSPIDDLLAAAFLPVSAPPASFDVGAALRRLADEGAQSNPPTDVTKATHAAQRLAVVCRWILNEPGAAAHVDRLTEDAASSLVEEAQLDVEGAAIFACLLYLTGHPESAQFWWQLAAGAGFRAAAYCLHLHHLALGEMREARHWRHQVTHAAVGADELGEDFLVGLEVFARYVRQSGCSAAGAPTGGLEMEIDRLAEHGEGTCIIVRRPDRRLADHLHHFTRR